MTAELLALLDRDPAAGILAAADLREQRAKAATAGATLLRYEHGGGRLANFGFTSQERFLVADLYNEADREHIAAEANPAHALAAVRRWRGVVERHRGYTPQWDRVEPSPRCTWCRTDPRERIGWPCPDVVETAAEARAYLGGAA